VLSTARSTFAHLIKTWVRRLDTRLTVTAARNAAHEVASLDARRLENARTLRDLRRLQVAQ